MQADSGDGRHETAVVVRSMSFSERQWLPVGNQCPCSVNEDCCNRSIGGELASFSGIKDWVGNIASGHNGRRSAGRVSHWDTHLMENGG